MGVPYRDRGRRLDETVEAMRVRWRDDLASYRGRYVQFENVHMDARPARAGGVPILIGGSTDHAARRASHRIELSIWPGSYDFTKSFDLGFVRAYVDRGADRIVASSGEAQTADIAGQRDWIRRYQDQILAKL